MSARGLIIRESLTDDALPEALLPYVTKRYTHLLGGIKPVEVAVLEAPANSIPEVAGTLAARLRFPGYYAHFIDGDRLWVIFPHCICFVLRGDQASADRCVAIGSLFGIPENQMKFQALFEVDHPNAR